MPSEHNYQHHSDSALSQQQQNQTKSCPSCCALISVPELDAPATCPHCRGQVLLRAAQSQNNTRRFIDQDIPQLQPPRDLSSSLHNTRLPLVTPLEPPPASPAPLPSITVPTALPRIEPSLELSKPYNAPIYRLEDPPVSPTTTNLIPHSSHSSLSSLCQPHSREPQEKPSITQVTVSTPDPLADITRIRMRTRANHCLYPGATFEGTQKSGRNSYDVTVTIVVCLLPWFSCIS